MNISKTLIPCLLTGITVLTACSKKEKPLSIKVENTLNIDRTFETIELSNTFLKLERLDNIGIRNSQTGDFVVTQMVDTNADGLSDQILFQPQLSANSEIIYDIVSITDTITPKAETVCYSRFVPERTDDYAWENDKVAFRVYGPTAQKLAEEGDPAGTLSSGVDAWLKRVSYPVIDKWYKETTEGTGSYHQDTGEGLDNFHVGVSRGVGGIAAKIDSMFYISKNYTKWKTITNGPIRTSFYLEYETWNAAGHVISESRIINLDRGNNLSKFTLTINGIQDIYAGLTLHEKDGKVSGNTNMGWVSYWQPHGDSELGTAIVADKNTFLAFETYDTEAKDLSNAFAHLKVENNQVVYYAGFGWKKSNQFETKEQWENYLNTFSECINTPLKVSLVE
ncbi:DUF4861 family protein [Aestuariibaculum suncheonense]|uniref:DUF4861 family protein n=1 Tax=Aestuariibaculum suncheonense TaxID=1028745 RepID=A0A8J6QEW1_9FLAO|nr:DUF4861 family protein [Aestuariibaculum suncheonense]MBD0835625.1 DUF4861 family protein [Aestuariibaculum suncheonense]